MKFVFYTDVHAHQFNDFSRNIQCKWDGELLEYVESDNGDIIINSRLFNILKALTDVRDFCVANNIKLVLNGGDTFHRRSILDVTTFNCVYRVLESYQSFGIRQIILSGNHDNVTNSDNSPSSVETFKTFADIITEPTIVPYFDRDAEEDEEDYEHLRFCCLPWMKDRKTSLEFIDGCLNAKRVTNILVGHLGLSGAALGSSYVMSDDYSLKDLKVDKWKYVLLGHYHHPQVLNENTIYGGSLLANNFGDVGPHGFWVIDTQKQWDLTMYELPYPQFLTLTPETVKNYTKQELEFNYVRVQTPAKDVDKVSKDLEDVGEVRLEIEKDYEHEKRSDISVTMSQEQILRTYVGERCDSEELAKKIIDKGIEIMGKVNGVM